MEFTQEQMDMLAVDEDAIGQSQTEAVIKLVKKCCTIPFISRYREENYDSLNEVKMSDSDRRYAQLKNLDERRLGIMRGIFRRGKLTESLYDSTISANALAKEKTSQFVAKCFGVLLQIGLP